jgi:hypothetical protein
MEITKTAALMAHYSEQEADVLAQAVCDVDKGTLFNTDPAQTNQHAMAGKKGSEQESGKMRILRGFLESDEFGLGGCQALRLQQQVIKIAVAPTTAQQRFDVSIDGFHYPHRSLILQ